MYRHRAFCVCTPLTRAGQLCWTVMWGLGAYTHTSPTVENTRNVQKQDLKPMKCKSFLLHACIFFFACFSHLYVKVCSGSVWCSKQLACEKGETKWLCQCTLCLKHGKNSKNSKFNWWGHAAMLALLLSCQCKMLSSYIFCTVKLAESKNRLEFNIYYTSK